jgi:hypothetical protein
MLVPAGRPLHTGSDAVRHGRIAEDGTVFIVSPDGEVPVGQWVAGTPAEGLAFFARRYDDLLVEVTMSTTRVRDGKATAESAVAVAAKVRGNLAAPDFIGDVAALAEACGRLEAAVAERREADAAERRARRAAALAERTALVVEAESLAESTDWKRSGDRLREILDSWKAAGRADKGSEQVLWRRLSTARTTFERRRRLHFATLDATRKDVVARKEALIASAVTLAKSTDWAATTREFRSLVDRWKAAGRASKVEDDRLWERFKAAQDAFFAARAEADAAADARLAGNVAVKESLALEAEALLPISDLKAAKETLRSIQTRWDAAGELPRSDRDRLEKRLKAVEEAVRAMDSQRWQRDNPEARARAAATVERFRAAAEKHEAALARATSSGDARAAEQARGALESVGPLLEAAERALAEFGG